MATNTEPSFRNNKMFRGGKDEMVDSMVETLVENVRTTYCNLIYFYQLALSNSETQAVEQYEVTKTMPFNLRCTKNEEILQGKLYFYAVLCGSKIAVFRGKKQQSLADIELNLKSLSSF